MVSGANLSNWSANVFFNLDNDFLGYFKIIYAVTSFYMQDLDIGLILWALIVNI